MDELIYRLTWRRETHHHVSDCEDLQDAIQRANELYQAYGPHVDVTIETHDGSMRMYDSYLRKRWKEAGDYIAHARQRWPNLPGSTYVISSAYQKAEFPVEGSITIPMEQVGRVKMGVALDDTGRVILVVDRGDFYT